MITQNLHTHCTYCDGSASMETMVQAAVKSGLNSLGFSSHACSSLPMELGEIKKEDIDSYFAEAALLKEKYKNQIEIFVGFEYESRTAFGMAKPDSRCRYSIGSVHLFEKDGVFYNVDHTPENFLKAAESFGRIKSLCENYFAELTDFAVHTDFDIVGHYDLVTKFIEKGIEDFTQEKWYRDMSLYYLEHIAQTGKIFEINTGAISRGWRTSPYPSVHLLKRLCELDTPVIISSDAHNPEALTCYFDKALVLLKDLGFKTVARLTENGFIRQDIKEVL